MNATPADTARPATADPAETALDPAAGPGETTLDGPDAEMLETIREILSRPRPPAAERQKVRDQYQLLADTYPGEYVAYRDVWDGPAFVRREVLAHAADIGDYWDQLAGYPDAEKRGMKVTYCEPLERRGKIVMRERWTMLTDPPE